MDYYEQRDDLDEPPLEQVEPSPIQQLFEGAHIFITGASGFMGKVLMEKLMRTCNVARIYILVRDKKGVKSRDRLAAIFEDRFFEPLRVKKPREIEKIKIVSGDCSLPDLGLSEEDKALMSHVNIIFHVAASLQMDQHLRTAYLTNVLATRFLLDFAKTLPYLKAFMYVSTAYTHAYKDLVEETFYNVVFDEDQIGQICEQLDDVQIGALTPKLIGRWGNTYALTKASAENLVSKYDGILPIGVVRPSIVVSVWKEPLMGWINNLYGAVGVVAGTALGLLRVWCADPNMVGDMIPVDMAINMTLAATWEVALKNDHLKVYNCVSSPKNPLTYAILRMANMRHGNTERIESTHSIGTPQLYLVQDKFHLTIYSLWYHIIPAYFIDIYLKATGKEVRLMKVYSKIYNLNKTLMAYCVEKHIQFTSDNVNRMWDEMDPIDQKLFNFDLKSLSWEWFWLNALKGMRVYLVNDPMETIPEGIKHAKRLWIRKLVFDIITWSSVGSLVYFFFLRKMMYLFL